MYTFQAAGLSSWDRVSAPYRPSPLAPSHRGEDRRGTGDSLPRTLGNASIAALAASMGEAAGLATIHRCGPVPCHCPPVKRALAESGLTVSHPSDPMELEAEQAADHVMRMPEGKRPESDPAPRAASSIVDGGAGGAFGGGEPLDVDTRRFMENRFGRDLRAVRIHTDATAGDLAGQVSARAFTLRNHVFFASGAYRPDLESGRRLLAHELTHVIQEDGSPGGPARTVHRQASPIYGNDADVVAEREYGNNGAPKAKSCGAPSHCPPGFCSPYRSEDLAKYYRSKDAWWLLAGISAAVDSRVAPLWSEYLWGGSAPKNLTSTFGADFTASPSTRKATVFLHNELRNKLTAEPLFVSQNSTVTLDIARLIPAALAELGDPASTHVMNFNIPRDVPGNLAGGVGTDQTACPSGAQPSPFNDERHAQGSVTLVRGSGPEVTVTPAISFTVRDTIDLCPGDCGTLAEQIATVPLSQFEATGISGDVPFTVEFAAPALGSFSIQALEGPSPAPVAPVAPVAPAAPKKP